MKRAKYGNVKCSWRGEKFDSKRELERHLVLLDMQKRGEIRNLQRQVRFPLVVEGVKICDYVPDWTYIEERGPKWNTGIRPADERQVADDCKGYATPEWKLKFKLAKALYPGVEWRTS